MTCLDINNPMLYITTATRYMQWRMDTETGTHKSKIKDTYASGKIDKQNFNIYSVACVQFKPFYYHQGALFLAMMNSYLPWKGMQTITKVCAQV